VSQAMPRPADVLPCLHERRIEIDGPLEARKRLPESALLVLRHALVQGLLARRPSPSGCGGDERYRRDGRSASHEDTTLRRRWARRSAPPSTRAAAFHAAVAPPGTERRSIRTPAHPSRSTRAGRSRIHAADALEAASSPETATVGRMSQA